MVEPKFRFSEKSLAALNSCHPDLITLFKEVVKFRDCKILEGYRGKELQDEAYERGASKLKYPNGKHNGIPSMAVDVTPFLRVDPINLNDIPRHIYFGGFVMGIADTLFDEGKITHRVRWGGDWDGDLNPKDGWDYVHFELIV